MESLVRLLRAKVKRRKGGMFRIRDAFDMFCDSENGKLNFKRFKAALESENIQLLATQASNLFDYIDKDYTGQIDFEDFKREIFHRSHEESHFDIDKAATRTRSLEKFTHGRQNVASVPHLRNALRKYFLHDKNALSAFHRFRKGKKTSNAEITFMDFKSALKAFNFDVSDLIAGELFGQIETSGDGKIDFQEFAKEFFGNDTQRYLARTTDWILGIKKGRAKEREKIQMSMMNIPEPFEVLKRKIRFGFGGISCRLAFRRFKTTLCVKESVDFTGFKKALVHLGIQIGEKDARTVFDHVDKDKSGIVDYEEFQSAIYGGDGGPSLESTDWTLRNARDKAKRVAQFTNSCNLVRLPSQLYNLLRAMFVSVSSYRQDAFRKFMNTSGTSNSQITVDQMKRAIRLKGLKTAPGIAERLFLHLDTDGSGGLSFNEFAKAFFDENLSQKYNLNQAPVRKRRSHFEMDGAEEEFDESKVASKQSPSSNAIIVLREKIARLKVNGRALKEAFRKHKTQSASTTKPTAVDLRGMRDALISEGIKFENHILKQIFFELDRGNRGFITFQDFAILSGVRIPKAGKRKSTLPGMQERQTYIPSPSRQLRRKKRINSGDKGVRGQSVPRRRVRKIVRPTTASSRRPNTARRRPGTGSSTARYMKRSAAGTWEHHKILVERQRRQRRRQRQQDDKVAWS